MEDISAKYEILDHTADLGIEITSDSYQDLFIDSAKITYSLLTDHTPVSEKALQKNIPLTAIDKESLLHDWIAEVISLFWSDRIMLTDFIFNSLTNKEAQIEAKSTKVDFDKIDLKEEIKAVTYHNFTIKNVNNKFIANIIYDI